MAIIGLSKLDVAKRELEYSIRLFFLSGDPVIIHLVASAAQDIIQNLSKKQGFKTYFDEFFSSIKLDKRKIVRDKLREAQNFMKHADIDEDLLLKFNPELTEFIILESVDFYFQLTKEVTGLMQAFRLYFYLKNPESFDEIKIQEVFSEMGKKLDINNRNQFLEYSQILDVRRTK